MRSFKYILCMAALAAFWGCNDGEGEADYGLQYVYMPQATVSGGLNNHYRVPSGDGKYTYNFRVNEEDGTLEVLLGVIRSGTQAGKGFTVDIDALEAPTLAAINDGEVANAELLPSSAYTLPDRVTVPDKSNSASFYLVVDLDVLRLPAYDGKNLVLTVGLANPSDYELSETNTTTLVIIDVDAIREHF